MHNYGINMYKYMQLNASVYNQFWVPEDLSYTISLPNTLHIYTY